MAKTKLQKKKIISDASSELKKAKSLLFADFSGTPVADLSALRRSLRDAGAKMSVVKKRLLDIALKERGLTFKAKEFAPAQLATIFVSGNVPEIAGPIYRFSKTSEKFQILGGLDLENGATITAAEIKTIGQLPPRPVLLSQLLGTMIAPLRSFIYLIQERSKRSSS